MPGNDHEAKRLARSLGIALGDAQRLMSALELLTGAIIGAYQSDGFRTAWESSKALSDDTRGDVAACWTVPPPGDFDGILERLPDELRDRVLERAAIVEFDGGLTREDAEHLALTEHNLV